jgi:hypothetical protein
MTEDLSGYTIPSTLPAPILELGGEPIRYFVRFEYQDTYAVSFKSMHGIPSEDDEQTVVNQAVRALRAVGYEKVDSPFWIYMQARKAPKNEMIRIWISPPDTIYLYYSLVFF